MAGSKYLGRILLVDDDESITRFYETFLTAAGFIAHSCHDLKTAKDLLTQYYFDAVLLDLHLGDEEGIGGLPFVLKVTPSTKVFILTSHGSIEKAVECMRRGATSFFTKGTEPEKILAEITAHLKPAAKGPLLDPETRKTIGLVGDSPAIKEMLAMIDKIRNVDSTVLILGESGTGKEVVARAIHQTSPRAAEPFNAINCGAIPEQLLESELFGHKRGSFTDAKTDRKGIFEVCTNGTLLLDEIGDMPLALQTKLLRVLQERQVTPIGSSMPLTINTRVIAATHRDILDEAKSKRFREDLYYRLSVVVIRIPPLRHRTEDIPALTTHFLRQFNQRFAKNVRPPSASVMARMMAYDWPGNVRELQNALERAVVLSNDDELSVSDIFQHLNLRAGTATSDETISRAVFAMPLTEAKQCFEKSYLEHLLTISGGNISEAARISGRYRADIYRLMHRYGFDKGSFR
ncbi:MAG: sigma-54 dependent transcriptional regulator [Proteobacteria bacterium]|nr:sigma-54 dependent transcriptional regulator [Pseudomonadota bacterium]